MASYSGYKTATEFDAGYDNFITPDVVAHWDAVFRADSERALKNLEWHELRHGPKERNAIDFFPAAGGAAPVLVAVHGGLWFLFDKWFMHFLAEAFTRRGIHVACVNYGLAPGQGLGAIVEDARRAVAYLHEHHESLRIDRSRLSVLGHSAAGQIVALMSAAPHANVHRCIGVSGFYDIEPFAQTHFHSFTQFALDEYRTWNPLHHVSPNFPPSLLITGEKESSLIQQMTQRFASALRENSVPVETICAPEECHFSVLQEIGNRTSPLFEKVWEAVR